MNLKPLLSFPFLQRFMFVRHLPLAWFAGIRITELNEERCVTRLVTGWRTRNPFGSMYFGSLVLGAEVSMGIPVLSEVSRSGKSISTLIVSSRSVFHQRGTGKIFFTCNEVQEIRKIFENAAALENGSTLEMYSRASNEQGQPVSETWITWSFRERKKKQ
jgi:hypothetical protein